MGVTLLKEQSKGMSGWISAMIILAVVFYGCGKDSTNKQAIIGKWEGVEGKERINFHEEGYMTITKISDLGMTKVGGSYRFIDDDQIWIMARIELLGDSYSPIVCGVSVSKKELILTSPGGEVAKYRRR